MEEAFPSISFILTRVPFFLEPGYNEQPEYFRESHEDRMVRKFGSLEAFNDVKKAHGLIPRGAEVGLDESCGFTQAALDARVQSATLNSHRMVLYVTEKFGPATAEKFYEELNRRHFIDGKALNDKKLLHDSLEEALSLYKEEDVQDAKAYLESTHGTEEVVRLYEKTQALGINSIPTLVIDGGRAVLNGAASSAAIYHEISALLKSLPSTSFGMGRRLFEPKSVL